MRAAVLSEIRSAGQGATCDEVEIATASARVVELRRAGLIRRTGERRPTRSGRNAWVYVAATNPTPN
jgi:predicted transcriptional regulator